jgi:nicotinate-nucleotide adenylyltransferase
MLGIFGGTFDPIHFGHLRVALDAVEALGLERLHFVPLAEPVHRDAAAAGARHRLAMIAAAIADEPRFVADDRELRRGGASYTIDTLRAFRAELPRETLCLLLGSDAFHAFLAWREPLGILQLAHLAVLQRPGFRMPDDPELGRLVAERRTADLRGLRDGGTGAIAFVPVTQLDISATDIRERCAGGRSARYLTPDPVLQLIDREQVYPRDATIAEGKPGPFGL